MSSDRAAIAAPVTVGILRATQGFALGLVDFSRRKPSGAVGGAMVFLLILIAIFAPLISPFDPNQINGEYSFAAPGTTMPLGGNFAGQDVLSRLFYGGRISLFVGFVSIAIGITAGALMGAISAYYGGKFDLIVQRFVDAFIAFPGIILALALMAALGSSVFNIIIALVAVLAPSAIRTVRSQALALKEMDYVLAARAVGAGDARIIIRHIVPNCLGSFHNSGHHQSGLCHPCGGFSELPWRRRAAERADLGWHAVRTKPHGDVELLVGWSYFRACFWAWQCSGSTCWVTPCETCWTHDCEGLAEQHS